MIASTICFFIDDVKKRNRHLLVLQNVAMEGACPDDKAYVKLDLVGIGPLIRDAIED